MDSEGKPAIKFQESEAACCEQELIEAMNALGVTVTTYNYVAVDAAAVASECQTIAEIIANSIATEDWDIDDDNKHEPHDSKELAVELFDLGFREADEALDYLRRHVTYQSNTESSVAFQIIEKCLLFTSK